MLDSARPAVMASAAESITPRARTSERDTIAWRAGATRPAADVPRVALKVLVIDYPQPARHHAVITQSHIVGEFPAQDRRAGRSRTRTPINRQAQRTEQMRRDFVVIEEGARVLPDPTEVIPDDGRPVAVPMRFVQRRVGVLQHLEGALVQELVNPTAMRFPKELAEVAVAVL